MFREINSYARLEMRHAVLDFLSALCLLPTEEVNKLCIKMY